MFSRIFRVQINEIFHQYFSVENKNKFLIGHRRHSFSGLNLWKCQNKYCIILLEKIRKFVFGKFVKTCRELDLNFVRAVSLQFVEFFWNLFRNFAVDFTFVLVAILNAFFQFGFETSDFSLHFRLFFLHFS